MFDAFVVSENQKEMHFGNILQMVQTGWDNLAYNWKFKFKQHIKVFDRTSKIVGKTTN